MKISTRQYVNEKTEFSRLLSRVRVKAERRERKAEIKAVREAVDKYAIEGKVKDEKQNEWRQSMKDRESRYFNERRILCCNCYYSNSYTCCHI